MLSKIETRVKKGRVTVTGGRIDGRTGECVRINGQNHNDAFISRQDKKKLNSKLYCMEDVLREEQERNWFAPANF